jgi:hypothetical protein
MKKHKQGFIFLSTVVFLSVLLVVALGLITIAKQEDTTVKQSEQYFVSKDLCNFAMEKTEVLLSSNKYWSTLSQNPVDALSLGGYLSVTLSVTSDDFIPDFSPLVSTGLKLWLDASDPLGTGELPNNGSSISTWNDKSGNYYHATATNATNYPTFIQNAYHAKPAIRFDGINDFLSLNKMVTDIKRCDALSLFFVVNKKSYLLNGRILGINEDGANLLSFGFNSGAITIQEASSLIFSVSEPGVDVYYFEISASSKSIYRNGQLLGSNAAAPTFFNASDVSLGQLYAGASLSNLYNGDLFEVLLFNKTLTPSERKNFEQYLLNKWSRKYSATIIATGKYKNKVFTFQKTIYHEDTTSNISTTSSSSSTPSEPTAPVSDNLVLWLDGADPYADGTFPETNQHIAIWRDKSSNQNHALQASGTYQPYYMYDSELDANTIYFQDSGGNDYMTFTTNTPLQAPWSFFMRIKPYVHSIATGIMEDQDTALTALRLDQYNRSNKIGFTRYGVNDYKSSVSTPFSQWSIVSYICNGSNTVIRSNGSAGTISIAYPFPFKYISHNTWGISGYVADVLVYNKALSDEERLAVEDFIINGPSEEETPADTSFSPAAFPDLTVWLDASDPANNNTTPNNLTAISSWKDKSGQAHNAEQLNTLYQPQFVFNPLTAKQALKFNASEDDFLSIPNLSLGSNISFFVVATIPNSDLHLEFGANADSNPGFYLSAAGLPPVRINNGSLDSISAPNDPAWSGSSTVLLSFIYDGYLLKTYKNTKLVSCIGTLISDNPISSTFYINTRNGSSLFTNALISEIIIYDKALNELQISHINQYLNEKWLFTPASIENLALWLDASDPINENTTPANQTPLMAWLDKSPNSYHMLQSNSSGQPLLTNPSLLEGAAFAFDGVNDSLHNNAAAAISKQAHSIFIAFSPTASASAQNTILAYNASASNVASYYFKDNAITYFVSDHHELIDKMPNSPSVVSFIRQSDKIIPYLNSIKKTTYTCSLFSNQDSFSIGRNLASAQDYFQGQISEILYYDRDLSDTERYKIETYLKDKWLFQPSSISGLALWLDGQDPYADGTFPALDASISVWKDKSSNKNHALQTNTSYQPTFKLDADVNANAVYFDGTDDYMILQNNNGIATPWSYFVVIKASSHGSGSVLMNDSSLINTGAKFEQYSSTGKLGFTNYTTNIHYQTDIPSPFDDWAFISFICDGVNTIVRCNGSVDTLAIAFPFPMTNISDITNGIQGYVAENIVYHKALSDEERFKVENYLKSKWVVEEEEEEESTSSVLAPDEISDLRLWLDGSDESTMTKNASNYISDWGDKSSNQLIFSQTTAANQPQYIPNALANQGVVYFANDGLSNKSNVLYMPDHTIVVLFKAYNTSAYEIFSRGIHPAMNYKLITQGGPIMLYQKGTDGGWKNCYALENFDMDWNIYIASYAHSGDKTMRLWMNDSEECASEYYTGSISGSLQNRIMWSQTSGNFGRGHIAELIVYGRAITDTERRGLVKYLKTKWLWDPSLTDGCVLWLDGTDPLANGSPPANNTPIATWKDKSGKGNDAVQTNSTYQPTYTHNSFNNNHSLQFAAEDYMQIPNPSEVNFQEHTIFFVCYPDPLDELGTRFLSLGETTRSFVLSINSDYSMFYYRLYNGSSDTTTTMASFKGPHIYSASWDGALMNLYLDGQLRASQAKTTPINNTSEAILIGLNPGYTTMDYMGKFAEIIIYKRALSDIERERVENYLKNKWRFDPSCISDLSAWFDAADLGTISTSGTDVLSWNDKSGLNNHLNQTVTTKPVFKAAALNGYSVIEFNNAVIKSLQNIPRSDVITDEATVFIALKDFDKSDTGLVWRWAVDSNNALCCYWAYSNQLYFDFVNQSSGRCAVSAPASCHNLWRQITGRHIAASNTSQIYIDGDLYHSQTTSGTFGSASLQGYYTIGGHAFIGQVAELIMYKRALTDEEKVQVEDYLDQKWFKQEIVDIPADSLALWLDAKNPNPGGVTPNHDSAVSVWKDRSGNNDAIQNNATAQAKYLTTIEENPGFPAFSFDGSDYYEVDLDISHTSYPNITVFVAYVGKNLTYKQGALWGNDNGGWDRFYSFSSGVSNGSGWQTVSDGNTINQPMIATCEYANGTSNGSHIYINGDLKLTFTASHSTDQAAGMTVGCICNPSTAPNTFGLVGYIHEVIIYHRFLTTAEREEVENYLKNKWFWTPKSISGCTAWYDAADQASITKDGSNNVSLWLDKSGKNHHLPNYTAGSYPTFVPAGLNEKSVLSFNGTVLRTPYDVPRSEILPNTDVTIFIVQKDNNMADTGSSFRWYYNSSNHFACWWAYSNKLYVDFCNESSGEIVVNAPASLNNSWQLMAARRTSLISEIFINGDVFFSKEHSATYGSGSSVLGTLIVGGHNFIGSMGEIILYNRSLTDTEMNTIDSYLRTKWGFPEKSDVPSNGLSLWLDASDADSIVKDGSNRVSQWQDKSGNGNHAEQSNSTYQPLYDSSAFSNLGGINTTGWCQLTLKNYLDISQSQERTIFIAFDYTSLKSASTILGIGSDNKEMIDFGSWTYANRARLRDYTTNAVAPQQILTTAGTVPDGTNVFVLLAHNNGTKVWNNNNLILDDSVKYQHYDLTSKYLGIGWDTFSYEDRSFDGLLGEIIIYNRALSDTEREQITEYLSSKWDAGLPVTDGLSIWLDANDENTLTVDGSNNVSQWLDKSGNNYHFSSWSNKPVLVPNSCNGQNSINFSPSLGLRAQLTRGAVWNSNEGTFIFVCKPVTTSLHSAIAGWEYNSSNRVLLWLTHNNGNFYFDFPTYTNGRIYAARPSNFFDTWHIVTFRRQPTYSQVYFDGTLKKNGSVSAVFGSETLSTYLYIGSRFGDYQFQGNIAEAIIYRRQLTDDELSAMNTYLTDKWGL